MNNTALPRVLLVDDQPANLLALHGVLASLPVELVQVGSGTDALRALLTDEVALIVLDVQMPGLDGFETARHIKGRERTRRVPIIFLTAISTGLEHELTGYESGAVDYLAKPFEPDVLRAKVLAFVELSQRARLIERQNTLLADQQRELTVAAARLARSNAELERFAEAVARELRDPLFTASGFLELAAHRPDVGDAHGVDLLGRAQHLLGRAQETLAELQRLAVVPDSAHEHTAVPLSEVVDGARAQLRDLLTGSGARVHCDPLPAVRGDRWQLVRLFTELLANAVAFSGDGPPVVHVGISRRDQRWVVSVRDQGTGIGADDLPRLFTAFGRAGPGAAGSRPALGLAVCRRIVDRHDGEIWAESAPGRGATISFSLAMAEPPG